ncbi:unnamed protein product [Caenorhabditis brenneri]
MTSLTEIADVALIHVLERCSFSSVMRLRKVCKSLRKFIDESHLTTDLNHVFISISPALLQFRWTNPECTKANIASLSLEELNTILSIQSSKLETLRVSVHRQPWMLDDLEDILKAKRRPLQVLPYLDSSVLKIIHLQSTGWGKSVLDGMEELLETVQMKNAEIFKLSDFMVEKDLSKFFHFRECYLNFDKLAEEDLAALKEAFITSTHMYKFILQATNLDGTMAEKVFGEPSFDSAEVKIWYIDMKRCKKHLLGVECNKKTISFSRYSKPTISDEKIS